MSTTTILAPRAHTDSATDRDARSEASGGLDRYRTWVTDHRVKLDRRLQDVVAGDLDPIIDELLAEERRRQLEGGDGDGQPAG